MFHATNKLITKSLICDCFLTYSKLAKASDKVGDTSRMLTQYRREKADKGAKERVHGQLSKWRRELPMSH